MSFGSTEVLTGIDLQIKPGEFVAVVGRSGCGKSTLLRLLAGLEVPTTGRIQVGDSASPVGSTAIRMMFQEPRLLPWKSVVENVAVGLAAATEYSRKQRYELAANTLERVGLISKLREWPSRLSGGQRQRVALARALVSRPTILALDEPLGALDALTRIEMQQLVEDVWRDQKFTAVFVTHDVAEAVALADRVVLLEHGRISAEFDVNLPRPRDPGDARRTAIQGKILELLLKKTP